MRIILSTTAWHMPAASLASGLLTALAFPLACGPVGQPALGAASEFLAWLGLVPLILALEGRRARKAFFWGWLGGVIFFSFCLYWLASAISVFGRLPAVVAWLILLLLVAFLALFWGAGFAAAAFVEKRLKFSPLWTLPVFWSALEFARNYVFTGFPWASLGTSQVRTLYLAQLAWLGGPYLVAFSVLWINCALVALWRWWRSGRRLAPYLGMAPLLMLVAALLMLVRLQQDYHTERPLQVGVIQGNLDEKVMQRQPLTQTSVLERMGEKSREAAALGAQLVVWPEGTLPRPLAADEVNFAFAATSAELLSGALVEKHQEGQRWLFNSAVLVSQRGDIRGRYDKVHLVPFGEYVPLGRYLPLHWFVPPTVTFFTAGLSNRPLYAAAGRLGVLICYESIFPQIARKSVWLGAELLVNITNDSWYGPTSAPWQHMAQSRMRAIETGRYLVRAANTGPSALIDPAGRVLEQLPLGLRDSPVAEKMPPPWSLLGKVYLSDRQTPYMVLGDCFAWGCVLAGLLLLFLAWQRRGEDGPVMPAIPRSRKPPRKERPDHDGLFKSR